jgi:hypothetical protein
MQKPESRFIQKLHKKLSPKVHREHTNNPYRRGMPDVYYEGDRDCLWVEYKYLPRASRVLHPHKVLTELQQHWIRRAAHNNRPCAVIVGSPGGVVVLPGLSWDTDPITPHWVPLQEALRFITQQVCYET